MTRTRINLLKCVQTYILIALDKKHAVYIVLLISDTLKLLLNLLMADSDTDVFSEVLRWKSSRLNRQQLISLQIIQFCLVFYKLILVSKSL